MWLAFFFSPEFDIVFINWISLLFIYPLTPKKEMSDFALKRHRYNKNGNIH